VKTPYFAAEDTLASALIELGTLLAEAGLDEPRREARLLLAVVLDMPLAQMIAHPDQRLGAQAPRLSAMTRRRMAHEPLSRLLDRRGFMDLDLMINPATLDPRPETEHLVEAVLARLEHGAQKCERFCEHTMRKNKELEQGFDSIKTQGALDRDAALNIIDLGTGSGAILIALLRALPHARAIGVDRAEAACHCARANAARYGLDARADFICGDLGTMLKGGFDVVVSNPPYIPTRDLAGLAREVREHDPVLALDGGADGLYFYRRLAGDSPRLLKAGGLLAVEIGAGQAQDVAAIFRQARLQHLEFMKDYAGHIRVVCATTSRPASPEMQAKLD
jgi:release factor glutamine methyltransferase